MCTCFGINCSFSIPCDQLVSWCFPHEGAPRRRSINGLQDTWRRLKADRDYILRKIEESPEMRPLEPVNEWLQQVVGLEGKIKKLITSYNGLHLRTNNSQESSNNSLVIGESLETRPPEEAIQNSKCFCSCSPIINRIKSGILWRKIQLMNQKVLDLLQQKPDHILERPRIAPALQLPTEPTTGMQLMLDEVWRHIENQQDHVGLIGLYGMGGVGKTTLLKAVNNKLCGSTLNFDLQLWIVVSKTPNLLDIQHHIGGKIGLRDDDWKVKGQDEKATDIYNVLCQKKYILLLDDIWERFDLVKIGIPLPNLTNKSKIIFTTRSLQVCGQMRAKQIQVQCLREEEAWKLFKENVGEDALNAHRDILGLARDVMRECNGLPLVLNVIGRAMSLKTTVHDWKHAINVLQGYAADFSTITEEVFIPLKYSYDNLPNDAIRSCLLYCSLYAEDQEILKSDLVDKWICEGFQGRFFDLEKDRNEGYSYINTLVHASLLEKCSLEENVKMHDMIRDMALWIGGDVFYVKARARLTEVPNDVKWGQVEKLSLMDNSIVEINNGPTEVTNIKTMLFYKVGLSSINNDFWKFVPNLKVLDLSGNQKLTSLPEEFGDFVSLQYLNLSSTNLKELPYEFRKLVKLQYLNVEYTRIYTIPGGVLSSMKELSVFRCGHLLYYTSYYDFLGENLVKEFEGLKCLQDVRIPAISKIEISNLTSSINLLNCITCFILTSFMDSCSLDILFLKEIEHLRFLRIDNLKRVERIVVGEGQDFETLTIRSRNGFNTLRHLEINNCSRLTNLSWLVFLPNIEYIELFGCAEMQTLVSENEYNLDNEVEVFAKLQTLMLLWMPELESIYFTSLPFPCLNILGVSDCHSLKKLPFNSSSCNQGRGITISCENKWRNELQWEDEATRTTFSSCLQSSLDSSDAGPNIWKGRKSLGVLLSHQARLKAARDDISRDIEESPEMGQPEIVNQWLRRVETIEIQVEKIRTDYYFQSDIASVDQQVLDLLSQVPDVVFERPQLVPTESTIGEQSTFDEVWSHIENQQDNHVGLIGLCGMGGIGKTALLKAVYNKLCSSPQNFDLQLWIDVSKSPNPDDIQYYIGRKIGFNDIEWMIKSQDRKATDIYNFLCEKKYILLLDSLWERFNLTKIGIPLPNLTNKSMVIFTTRSKKVCGQMRARQIQVQCLKEEEAWNLFKENVGEKTLNAHRDIPRLAEVVMRECSGLPLALIVIGRAMTLKMATHDWEHAIDKLQGYAAEFSTMTGEVFVPLKYSYDILTNDAIRDCLLYCSLYAEDQNILKSDLVDKWICEGFLSRFGNLDKDRNEGYSYINTLVDASLLEESFFGTVKMHAVIRDMAQWIARDVFYVKARARLAEVPKDVKWGYVEKLSLMDNSTEELNNGPTEELNNGPIEATNLKRMLCNRGDISFIRIDFWKLVPKLKVLDLSSNKNLWTLPKEIGDLVCLQYLNLSCTPLENLPNTFKKLVKLKYLNVELTSMCNISERVLSSMKELSVFIGGNIHTQVLDENLVKVFEGLKCLQDVQIWVTSKVEISNLTSSINLLNCITRFTMTSFSDSTSLDILFLKEMKQLQFLTISNLKNVQKIVVGEGQDFATSTRNNRNGFNNLRSLDVYDCPQLTNLSWLVFLRSIEYIHVSNCWRMQTLVSENEYKLDNEVEPFAKLQALELWGFWKLESIYFTSLSFPCLKRLSVGRGCNNLIKLPFNSSSCDQGCGITIDGPSNDWWNGLQWEDEATRTAFSSCFQSLPDY